MNLQVPEKLPGTTGHVPDYPAWIAQVTLEEYIPWKDWLRRKTTKFWRVLEVGTLELAVWRLLCEHLRAASPQQMYGPRWLDDERSVTDAVVVCVCVSGTTTEQGCLIRSCYVM